MPEVENAEVVVEEPVETHEGFINLENHQKDVNVQHKRFRDEERSRVAQQERADVAEKALEELKGKQAEVVIPAVDPYSETFQDDIRKRDEAVTAQADQNAANETAQAALKTKDEARQADESEALNKRVATFNSNLVSHGMNEAEVKAAAEGVIGLGISTTFQDILLDDKDGPLFVKYLDAHPLEAEQINAMSTMELVGHMNAEIRPKALLLKPQTSTAPTPPITLTGGGAPETGEWFEEGGKYS